MNSLLRDFVFGFRMLCKSPGFTMIVVLTIGLGIGANTTIFSMFNGLILQPLPYENSERLARIYERGESFGHMSTSYPNFLDWRDQNQTFVDIACIRYDEANMTGSGTPLRIQDAWVSASFFDVLGVQPVLGRFFTEEDDQPGERTLVLSHHFWQQQFGGDPEILGEIITLDFRSHTVIGVAPEKFNFPHLGDNRADVWTPVGLWEEEDWLMDRGNHPGFTSFGLLKEGVTLQQSQTEFDRITSALEQQYPNENTGQSVRIYDLQDQMMQDVRPIIFALLSTVLFVLLICCANIINLMLARSTARQQEIAVRTAMGISRIGLIRQFFCESLLLTTMGAVLGIFIAIWGLNALLFTVPDKELWAIREILTIDTTVLFYTTAITVITAFIFGIIPAVQHSKLNLNTVLKDSGRTSSGGKSGIWLRNAVTGTQISLALVLLVCSGLTLRSLMEILDADLGYNPQNVLRLDLSLPRIQYEDDESRRSFFRSLLAELHAVPGIEHAALASPLLGGWQSGYQVEGEPVALPGQGNSAEYKYATPEFKDAMGLTLLQGRFFTEADTIDSTPVVIVDEKMAELHWPNENPIGKRMKQGSGEDNENEWMEVIGVIRHIHYYGVEDEARQEVLLPFYQDGSSWGTLAIRTTVEPNSIFPEVQKTILGLDNNLAVSNVQTLESFVVQQTIVKRILTSFLGIFAAIALFLSSIGIYGVMSYTITQRHHEFGIRMALGAGMLGIVQLVLRQGLLLICCGIGAGLLVSILVSYLLASQLYNVSVYDPVTYIAVAVVLIVVAGLACLIPAVRASMINPLNALRYE